MTRNDILTTDPDTPPAHIQYEVSKISHGRFVLLPEPLISSITNGITSSEIDQLKDLPSAIQFTQVYNTLLIPNSVGNTKSKFDKYKTNSLLIKFLNFCL